MTNKELIAILKTCRKFGVTSFKDGGTEFTLSPSLSDTRGVKKRPSAIEEALSQPSDEDLMFYSVDQGFSESEENSGN